MDGPCETREAWMERLRKQNPHLTDPNPMVQKFNYGPDGKRCKDCEHRIIRKYESTYFKCAVYLKKNTKGPGTDIRANWNACKKFVEAA